MATRLRERKGIRRSGDDIMIACGRCGGFMVDDLFFDPTSDQGIHHFPIHRCVQCGDQVDPVILKNRRRCPC